MAAEYVEDDVKVFKRGEICKTLGITCVSCIMYQSIRAVSIENMNKIKKSCIFHENIQFESCESPANFLGEREL